MQHLIQCLNRHDIEQTDELLEQIRRAVMNDVFADKSQSKNLAALESFRDTVCKFYGITIEEFVGKRRFRKYAVPRQLYTHVVRVKTPMIPLKEIGETIGGRDHTTIMHENQAAKDLIDTDEAIRQDADKLMNIYVDLLSPTQ